IGSGKGLARLDVRCLQALVALHDLELDLLTLGQRLVAFPCNRREVDEDVLAALALDEAVALLVREPLDGALGQLGTPFLHKQRRPGHRAADLSEAAGTLDAISPEGKFPPPPRSCVRRPRRQSRPGLFFGVASERLSAEIRGTQGAS